ncbi:MAG: TRAP transporter small permease subunit [Pseudomonadota bacterium]
MNPAPTTSDHPLQDQPIETPPPGPGWSALEKVTKTIDSISEWSGRIASFLIIGLIVTMVYEVVARYFFASPTIWASDMTYMLYGSMFMLGAAYTLRHRGHIRTDFLYGNFPVRVQGAIDTVAYLLLFLPAITFFLWYGWQSFYSSWQLGERAITSPWAPVIYPFRAVLPITAVLLILQGVSESLKSIHAVVYARWP